MSIYFPPTQNSIQKTLDAQLLSGVTASMTLNNVVGIANKPGVCVVDFVDTNNVETPTKREYIAFTGVSGNTLTGLTRNADGGGSDQDHVVGAIVQFPPDILQQKAIIDTILVQHGDDGVHTDALVTSLKASGAEINTGTEDAKIVTPKALADSEMASGWTPARETWTYASATTITVPSGAASKYAKGDKIKLTQSGTVKYFYIISVADTVLTITGGSDYTLVSATISANYYSHASSPIGFPQYMNYVWTGIADSGINKVGKFSLIGTTCFTYISVVFTAGITFTTMPTLPIKTSTSLATSTGSLPCGIGLYLDAGTTVVWNTFATLTGNSNIVTVKFGSNGADLSATSPITWANGDILDFNVTYEI